MSAKGAVHAIEMPTVAILPEVIHAPAELDTEVTEDHAQVHNY